MHPAPVATHDSTPVELPAWTTGEPETHQSLDLIVYPEEDELPAAEVLRRIDHVLSRVALVTAAALLGWMLIGIALAHHAGRI